MIDWLEIRRLVERALVRCFRSRERDEHEEVVQAALFRLLLKPDWHVGVRDMPAFLTAVALNTLRSHLKTRRRRAALLLVSSERVEQELTPACDAAKPRRAPLSVAANGDRAVRVYAAYCECGSFKGAARSTGLDVRQVKRCLRAIALAMRAARESRNASPSDV